MDLRIEDVLIRKVVTVPSDCTVEEAVKTMDRHSTSCLVILSEGRVDGIVTNRDMVYRLVAEGLDPSTTYVQEIATSPVVLLKPDDYLGEAIKIMLQKKIKKIPLVNVEGENARLVGLLSFSDLVEYHSDLFATLWEQVLITVPASGLEEGLLVTGRS
ncbi:MAG: CBS domain-containing protein [Candidatus Bathyarchaeota archaeon]|jgi:CBS domain-containing protein